MKYTRFCPWRSWRRRMREGGLEPPRGFPQRCLRPQRLPIPPLRLNGPFLPARLYTGIKGSNKPKEISITDQLRTAVLNPRLVLMSNPKMRYMMKGKIHRARVSDANVEYEGSIAIDSSLMEGANILPYEKVDVLSVDSGTRLTTYAIPAEPRSGVICVNGAAAKLIGKGEKVIIVSYGMYDEADAQSHSPSVVKVDDFNQALSA